MYHFFNIPSEFPFLFLSFPSGSLIMHMLICSIVSQRSQALFIFLRLDNLIFQLLILSAQNCYWTLQLFFFFNFSCTCQLQNFNLSPFIISVSLLLFSIWWDIVLNPSLNFLDMAFISWLKMFRIAALQYWVGQHFHLWFSTPSYGKAQTNFLANSISLEIYLCFFKYFLLVDFFPT